MYREPMISQFQDESPCVRVLFRGVRTARKQHGPCPACNKTINPGERYQRTVTVDEDGAFCVESAHPDYCCVDWRNI